MVFVLIVLSLFVSSLGIHCPQSSWVDYKKVEEGSWSFAVSSSTYHVDLSLTRDSSYKCNSNSISFESELWQLFNSSPSNKSDYYNFVLFSERNWHCSMECDMKLVNFIVKYQERSENILGSWTAWSVWKCLEEFFFLNKNCEKLYWTNWVETSNCENSVQTTFTRNCTDCYNDTINQQYCNGNATMQVTCQPMWSEWGEAGNCISLLCNTTGEQIRTRKCLYGDGSEASNVQLCSEGSPNMTESCVTSTVDCEVNTNTDSVGNNLALYVSVGVSCFVVIVIFVMSGQYLFKRLASPQKNHNQVNKNLSIEHHVYDTITEGGRSESRNNSVHPPIPLNADISAPINDGYLSTNEINSFPNFTLQIQNPLNSSGDNKDIDGNNVTTLRPQAQQNNEYECPISSLPVYDSAYVTAAVESQDNATLNGYEVPMSNRDQLVDDVSFDHTFDVTFDHQHKLLPTAVL